MLTMKFCRHVLLLSLLISCSSVAADPISTDSFEPLVREYAFRVNPMLNPSVQFKIEEFPIEDLWDTLHMQIFSVRYMSGPDSESWFSEDLLIYLDDELVPFASAFGGFGLTSAVMSGEDLYFSYSWGSGMHRSHLGRISVTSRGIEILDSGGFIDFELFVDKDDAGLIVFDGGFEEFNSWTNPIEVGRVRSTSSSIKLTDSLGEELEPDFTGSDW